MSAIKINAQRKAAGLPLIRYRLTKLSEEDINDLRDAYQAAYEISEQAPADERGYWAIARGHGFDLNLCHRDSRLFLTWHRAYLYVFEKTLNAALKAKRNDPDIELTLPFWDWTESDPSTHAANGLPIAVNDATYKDNTGNNQPNPLFRAKSMYREQARRLTGDDVYTQRNAENFYRSIPEFRRDVADYMNEAVYAVFNSTFDRGAHGGVHVDVGGDMGSVVSAAYDPIFWLHHCMVDKVFFDWQNKHPQASISQHVRDSVVYGDMTGEFVLEAESNLKYIYSSDAPAAMVETAAEAPEMLAAAPAAEVDMTRVVPLGPVGPELTKAQIDFHQTKPPINSYKLKAYVNLPEANAETSFEHPNYGGQICFFGHGNCFGADGHCDPYWSGRDSYDTRPDHPLRYKKTSYSIDISRCLKGLTENKEPVDVNLYLVLTDSEGKQVPVDEVSFSDISLVTT